MAKAPSTVAPQLTTVAVALLLIAALHVIAFVAPVEASMGIVQKIFYFHVPAAYGMYLGALACFVGSAGLLATGHSTWDHWARGGAEVAVLMGAMVMTSGPLWAAKAWGVYWTWDPRLTTSLLTLLIYASYVLLRSFAGGGEAERRFAAALGVLGAAMLPIVHYSVQKWGGNHPKVISTGGGGLQDPNMKLTLLLGFAVFTLLSVLLVWLRARVARAEERIDELEMTASYRGLVTQEET